MSRQVRNRVTATVLGGFLLGAALLTTGTANAGQVEGGGRQVVFEGAGVLGLSCESTPSVEALTVPADGTVRLVNRTGHDARLRLNGESQGSIRDDDSTEVVFRRGTTAVTLDPRCAITDPATPVLVTASPVATTDPDPMPGPAGTSTGPAQTPAAPSDPGTPGGPTDSGSAAPGSVVPMPQPSRPSTTKPGRPARIRPDASRAHRVAAHSATTAAQAVPRGGTAPRGRTKTPTSGTAGAAVPAFTGMPPGDDKSILPGVPALGLPSPPTTAAPARPADPSAGIAAEPVAAMRPLPDSQPIGLLALIATVSVLGVTTAAIRAIVSQRAYRARVA